VNRRDFLKLAGVGTAAGLAIPYYGRKKKMTIAFDTAFNSGYSPGVNTYSWDHALKTSARIPGLVVGVSIFGAATVTSISGEEGGTAEIRQFTFVREDHNGNYRSEIWQLLVAFDFFSLPTVTIAVNLSGTVDSCAGSASFSYYGGIGAHDGANGTGDPASKALTPNQPNSYVLSNLCAQTASGITNATLQNNRWDVPGASGTGMGSDKLVATPASTTLQFNGISGGHSWAQSSVELLSYVAAPPAIMG
jgi:TAT (twin-arginine translocation) pathway-exported protein